MSRESVKSDWVDVIVVLGAAVWEHGVPSPALRRRVLYAVELLHSGLSNTLLVTGGVGKYPPAEAQVMRRLAVEHGVFEEQIIMEETAKSTLESAISSSDIIKKNGWSTALIVTDKFHLFRSILLFRQFGIHVIGSAPKGSKIEMGRLRWWHMILREVFAIPWSIILACMQKTRQRKHT